MPWLLTGDDRRGIEQLRSLASPRSTDPSAAPVEVVVVLGEMSSPVTYRWFDEYAGRTGSLRLMPGDAGGGVTEAA